MAMILVPAYGRDYQTAAEVKAAWEAGKDFVIANLGPDCGRYISKREAEAHGIPKHSYIRFRKLTELTIIGEWDEPEEDE
jgi:hypothetical protein